jgi:hypothetical protein
VAELAVLDQALPFDPRPMLLIQRSLPISGRMS